MAKKERALGRGLGSVFGNDIDNVLSQINEESDGKKEGSSELRISEIRANPYQPRKVFSDEEIKELSDSIKENGLIQPIIVRKSISGYELIAGERRLRASKLAGLKTIPAIIREYDDRQMMEISLLENIQRKDLTAIEEAEAYEQLQKKLNYTQEEVSKRVGKSRSHITNTMRLLRLPLEVRKMILNNSLSGGHARALVNIDDEDKIIELANKAVKEGISVREIEKLSKTVKKNPVKDKTTDPFLEAVRKNLERKLETQVELTSRSITIKYNSVDDLNRILETIDCLEEN